MKHYKFILTPEYTHDVDEYLTVGDDFPTDEIENDPDGFFEELVGDRYPGYVLAEYEEISASEIPAGELPFEIS